MRNWAVLAVWFSWNSGLVLNSLMKQNPLKMCGCVHCLSCCQACTVRLEGVFTTTSVWSSVKALKDLDRLCGFREPGKDRAGHMVKLLVCCPEVLCSSRGFWWWNQNAGTSSSKVLGVSCTWYLHNCWFSGAWVKTLECGVLPFEILSDNPSPFFLF